MYGIHSPFSLPPPSPSDDRSEDVFRQRLESATEMQAVLTEHAQPNCLIIDEIDGAPTVSTVLLSCIYMYRSVRQGVCVLCHVRLPSMC